MTARRPNKPKRRIDPAAARRLREEDERALACVHRAIHTMLTFWKVVR